MWEIGSWTHKCQKYVCLNLYLSDELNERITITYITSDVHLVNDLQANLLIDMNIIGPEQISMNISSWKIIIEGCCNMLVNLSIMSQKSHIHCIVRSFNKIVILLQSIHQVKIKTDTLLLSDRDLVFHLFYPDALKHIVDVNMSFVHIQNDRSTDMMIQQHAHLSVVAEYEEEKCYTDSIENLKLAVLPKCALKHVDMLEICLLNEVTIYGNKVREVTALISVMKTYSDLWHDCERTVDILKSDYLQVPLKSDWKTTKLSKQIYSLEEEAHWLVDEKFDELHHQGWMKWSTQSTSFGFPVFIVWKTVIQPDSMAKQKGCIVVDIWGLNWISQVDFYPLPLQTDITAAVQKCHYILTVNCISFFYQWLINPADQHKFMIVMHCGQKHFNVTVMRYWNSLPYIQW